MIYDLLVMYRSYMNLAEFALNLYALALLRQRRFKSGAVVAAVVLAVTCTKMVLYHLMEIACNFCHTKHNDTFTMIALFFLPNGLWIWVPLLGVITLGRALAEETGDGIHGKNSKKQ